jgi:hypothetical protein
MVQLKIHTNFVRLKSLLKEPSLSDCLDLSCTPRSGLVIKGTLKCVSLNEEIHDANDVRLRKAIS